MGRYRFNSRDTGAVSAGSCLASHVQTSNCVRVLGPKVWVSGTSAASRPRAIRIRPMRLELLRGSNTHQRPSRKTSIQAAKSSGRVGLGFAELAQIAGAVAGRDVHATAKRDRQMREIAADTVPPGQRLRRRARRVGLHVVERDGCVHEVADRLHPRPARRRALEQAPRLVRQDIRVAVAAAKKIDQRLEGQILHGRCAASGATGSGSPLSRKIPSVDNVKSPAGATIRVHQFPNPSR